MLTVLFFVLMIVVFGRIAFIACKFTWGFTKVLLTLVFLPVILMAIMFVGLFWWALPILLLIGAISAFVK